MVGIRKPKTALKFEKPAGWWGALWREALPAGNGLIGAAVYGNVEDETIMLSHGNLSWQGYIGVLPDVAERLKDVRRAMLEGDPRKAEEILPNALISKNYRPQMAVPLPVCDLKVRMPVEKAVKEYARVLNMENGEISVNYRDGAAKFDRSLFVSRANDYIVYEISRSGQKTIDAEFSFEMHDRNNARTPAGAPSKLPDGVMTKYENFFMYFSARSDDGTEFGAVARISYYGGSQEVSADSIRIKGATDILVIVKLFCESTREKEWKALKTLLGANKATYDKLLKEHTNIHSKLMDSAELDLNAEDRDASVESLLYRARTEEVPLALVEKMWYFGRYLFLCSSREDGHLCSPYGLWCGDYKAPQAQAKANGILQMLYSICFGGNLLGYLNGLFESYENCLSDLKKNASRLYGCRGIMIPSLISAGTGLLGSVEPDVVHFTAGAGWIANLFYRYYTYTGDKKFLKDRALPFMKEACLFYEDFFKLGMDGLYMSCPSYSPENTPANFRTPDNKPLGIAMNSTIDFAVARELVTNLIEGAQECKVYKDEIEKWKDMLTKIPAYPVGADGSVKEYAGKQFEDNNCHAYASHLYPVFPGHEIFGGEGEQNAAFLRTAKNRVAGPLTSMKSWSYGYLASVFARLEDTDDYRNCLNHLVKSSVMDNLVTAENDWRRSGLTDDSYWAPYQIQGNISYTEAVTSSFAVSDGKTIKLLPVQIEGLAGFEVEGILVEGGVEVRLSQDRKRQSLTATFKARRQVTMDICPPQGVRQVKKGPNLKLENGVIAGVPLPAGKAVTFEFRY